MEQVNLCVIGSGSGNSLLDDRFSRMSVALVDAGLHFGGTCLNNGCIPTKMLVLPADLASSIDHARRLGVDLSLDGVRWRDIRDRVFRDRIDLISRGGLAWREQQDHVSVHRQRGHFVDAHTLELEDGHQIRAERFVLAAGSRPRTLPVPGFDDPALAGRIHTSDTIMRIDDLPRRLVISGAGFVAAEFAHVFSALGVETTIVHRGERLLRKADSEVSARFTEQLGGQVSLALRQNVVAVEAGDDGGLVVRTRDLEGTESSHACDLLLNAVGRVPNGDTLNLEAAGVEVDLSGFVRVDEYQRTSQPHIWALGDVASPWMLKHVANHEMRTVQHNLLHEAFGEGDALVASNHEFVPSAVFSHPQIAQVGLTEDELAEAGRPYLRHVQEYGSVAYGWALEDQTSFVKLLACPETRQLVGAHFIGAQASTLVQQCIQAMNARTDIDTMAKGQYWIHPALPEVIENCLLELGRAQPVGAQPVGAQSVGVAGA
ncbi:mycothione reductase [Aestuariimicrobium ganziense]|uniref:mycothione reductase n=1 Tax=Aestuariimicrobium ganziense TaxID=2773677 RepID=UPI0019408BBB|nr:mycothione reductase [Aestuariimicrobium ganziense]